MRKWVSRKDAKTQRLGEVRILEPEPKGAIGYARSLEFEDEIEAILLSVFNLCVLASLREILFSVFA